MKKLIRIEDILVSFISAIGWGIGYAIPKTWGFSELICIVSSIFMGLFMGILGNKLIKTKWAQTEILLVCKRRQADCSVPSHPGIPLCVWCCGTVDRRVLFSRSSLLQFGVDECLFGESVQAISR